MSKDVANADAVLSALKSVASQIQERQDGHRLSRRLLKIELAISRPLRIGVFGERQTGTSALINLLLDREILPPGRYGTLQPLIHVRYGLDAACALITDKERRVITRKAMLSALSENTDTDAANTDNVIYRAKPRHNIPLSRAGIVGWQDVSILEIQLPDPRLESCEFFEVPLSLGLTGKNLPVRNALRSIDFVICATLANQAWKRTELEAWKQFGPLPQTKSVLALISKEPLQLDDENKLSQRIRHEAVDWFKDFIHVPLSANGSIGDTGRKERKGVLEMKRMLNLYLNEIKIARRRKALKLLTDIKLKYPEIPLPEAPQTMAPASESTPFVKI